MKILPGAQVFEAWSGKYVVRPVNLTHEKLTTLEEV